MQSHTLPPVQTVEWSEADVRFMTRALEVAEIGRGRVSPNPLVGCVLVKEWRNNRRRLARPLRRLARRADGNP